MEADLSEEALGIVIVFPNTRATSSNTYVRPNEGFRPFDQKDWTVCLCMFVFFVGVIWWLAWTEGKKTHVPILKRTKNPWRRYKCVGYRKIKR